MIGDIHRWDTSHLSTTLKPAPIESIKRGIHLGAKDYRQERSAGTGKLSSDKSPRAAPTAEGMDYTKKGCTSWLSLPVTSNQRLLSLVAITQLMWHRCVRGFVPMRPVWTIWIGYDGPRDSSVRTARLILLGVTQLIGIAVMVVGAGYLSRRGTIFDKTRIPLTVWFETIWLVTVSKMGVSAAHLHRVLPISSYQTAWAMLAKLRRMMSAAGSSPLTGRVEVDETFLGGPRAGTIGRGALGKTLVAGAIEITDHGWGRARWAVIVDAAAQTWLRATDHRCRLDRDHRWTAILSTGLGPVHAPADQYLSHTPARS